MQTRKLFFPIAVPALLKSRIILIFWVPFLLVTYNSSAQDKRLPLRMLAYEYLQKNQVDEAEAAFSRAIKTAPKEISNYRDLALLYLTEKKYTQAESIAKAGLKQKPDDEETRSVLAKVYIGKGDIPNATDELNTITRRNSRNIFAYHQLAAITNNLSVKKSFLLHALSLSPSNVVIRLSLADILIQNNNADSALYYMQSIKKIAPDFSPAIHTLYNQVIQSLQPAKFNQASALLNRFFDLFHVTGYYIEGLSELEGPRLSVGYADFTSSALQSKRTDVKNTSLMNIRFTDATSAIGLQMSSLQRSAGEVICVADYSNAGEIYLYNSWMTGGKQQCHLLSGTMGGFQKAMVEGGIEHTDQDLDAAFIDYDNDGFPDLFIATSNEILIYRKKTGGSFSRQRQSTGLSAAKNIRKMLFADFDQDGDIDLYALSKDTNKFFRNNGDGTFTEQAAQMGLSDTGDTGGGDFADYDSDGDLDIVTTGPAGSRLFNNSRHSKFKDLTSSHGMGDNRYSGRVIAFTDYNNDGFPDLFVSGTADQRYLLKNNNGTGFSVDPASKLITETLGNTAVHDVAFFDFDNDGYTDLLVAGTAVNPSSQGVFLFHNEGAKGFSNASYLLPQSLQATRIAIADFNVDGDDDIFLTGPFGVRLLRNDGGNLNHHMQVQLTGLSYGSNKNNRLGIGAQVELKAGNLYQLKTVKRPVTNFGLGGRTTVDAVRIIWPNGTPQLIKDPSANERIMEEQMLKGSCPFLFVWNGERYEFLKDMMWRSALGMPVAINGKDTTYAFSDPSKEYLLIPGDKMKPRDNSYSIKITEELWEAVYFDKAALFAVDHPDSVEVFADEKFVAPPFPGKKLYPVVQKIYPATATDGNGNDVLPEILAYDFRYISHFGLGKYQGLTEGHDLLLDPGKQADTDSLMLFLRGWIFPTDASINTAMTQSSLYKPQPPSLQVINQKGEWQTVIPNIGFPMGKDKMVIVDMTGKFLTADRKIRIRTNMQIYWDEIFFSKGMAKAPVSIQEMPMTKAGLSFRGYSAMYRKGGPFGPHWFDYYQTSGGQQWRDLTGYYTRYGDVLPLLEEADDEYIIANSGDEITIEFDAGKLPPLPAGWKRDFLIYSEGWVKDGDLNTAYGQTVEPLPFHGMPSYPYPANHQYPFEKHKTYREQYNTRKITTEGFMNALKTEQHNTK